MLKTFVTPATGHVENAKQLPKAAALAATTVLTADAADQQRKRR